MNKLARPITHAPEVTLTTHRLRLITGHELGTHETDIRIFPETARTLLAARRCLNASVVALDVVTHDVSLRSVVFLERARVTSEGVVWSGTVHVDGPQPVTGMMVPWSMVEAADPRKSLSSRWKSLGMTAAVRELAADDELDVEEEDDDDDGDDRDDVSRNNDVVARVTKLYTDRYRAPPMIALIAGFLPDYALDTAMRCADRLCKAADVIGLPPKNVDALDVALRAVDRQGDAAMQAHKLAQDIDRNLVGCALDDHNAAFERMILARLSPGDFATQLRAYLGLGTP